MDINRKIAFDILIDIEKNQAYSNIALNKHLAKNKELNLNQGFIRELVYGVLENKIYLDYLLSKLITRPMVKNKTELGTIMRMGIYQIDYMNSVPDYAAVDECVNLVNKLYKAQGSFINGVLRNYLRKKEEIILTQVGRSIAEYLSIKYSHAQWIVDYWLKFYDTSFVEDLLIENNKSPLICIRANTLKIEKDELVKTLIDKGYEIFEGKLVSEAIYIKGNNLLDESLFKEGAFSVQDESSMLAVKSLGPVFGEFIIDTCAAPGGKSLYIAEIMGNEGTIIDFDIHDHKLKLIEKSAKKNSVEIIKTEIWNSKSINQEYIGKANKVIVDAPCSGLGVLRRKPELKYKGSLDSVNELSIIQYEMLESSSNYLMDKGILLYCTCTISIIENQKVTEKFLNNNSNFSLVEEIQLFPNVNNTDGFYICKMIKNS
jgi:16S rRNA (cytosine967-C5)-methyltransferase